MRYERKFFIQHLSRPAVEAMIYQHPAAFQERYRPRQINSIYFDSLDEADLREKAFGNLVRQKYRVRWYGEMTELAPDPILEIKKKQGELGAKDRFKIEPFHLPIEQKFNLQVAEQVPPHVALTLHMRDPILLVNYQRRYWRSQDKKFRLTLDWDLQLKRLQGFQQTRIKREALILEVKYDEQYDSLAQRICSFFPFRVTRSSKYALGMIGEY